MPPACADATVTRTAAAASRNLLVIVPFSFLLSSVVRLRVVASGHRIVVAAGRVVFVGEAELLRLLLGGQPEGIVGSRTGQGEDRFVAEAELVEVGSDNCVAAGVRLRLGALDHG